MKRLALLAVLISTPAFAADYVPPSQELWVQMVAALQGVSMPLAAHQQIANILSSVEQQALAAQAAQARAAAPK